MKKEKLLEYGLTEEQVEKWAGELKGYVPKHRVDEVNDDYKAAKADAATAKSTIAELESEKNRLEQALATKEGDESAVQALRNELKELKTQHANELETLKLDHAIESQLADAHDSSIVLGLIDRSGLSLVGDGVKGLEEKLAALREEKPFLFKDSKESPIQGAKLSEGTDKPGVPTVEEFGKMTYAQQLSVKEQNPALFTQLMKGVSE